MVDKTTIFNSAYVTVSLNHQVLGNIRPQLE